MTIQQLKSALKFHHSRYVLLVEAGEFIEATKHREEVGKVVLRNWSLLVELFKLAERAEAPLSEPQDDEDGRVSF